MVGVEGGKGFQTLVTTEKLDTYEVMVETQDSFEVRKKELQLEAPGRHKEKKSKVPNWGQEKCDFILNNKV